MEYQIVDTSKKPKSFAIKTIMKNKSLRDTISQGLNAAPGSTKRTKAAKLLRSLNKSGGNFFSDGMGGGEEASQFNPFSFPQAKANIIGSTQSVGRPNNTDVALANYHPGPMPSPEQVQFPQGELMSQQGDIDYSKRTDFVSSVDGLINPASDSASTDQSSVESNIQGATPPPEPTGASVTGDNTAGSSFGSSSLLELRRSGMGATGLMTAAMVDPSILTDFGLPASVADGFPRYSLEEQKGAIQETLMKKFGIEESENLMKEKLAHGGSIVADLTEYLAKTDTYFRDIDNLYNDTLERAASMDTSDPAMAKRVNNYTNYLKILRGKQNDRNVSFITMAGDKVEAEIKALNAIYNINFKQFVREYDKDAAKATELHKGATDTIKELEDNLDERLKLEDQKVMLTNLGIDTVVSGLSDLTDMGKMTAFVKGKLDAGAEYAEIDRDLKDYLRVSDIKYKEAEIDSVYAALGLTKPKTNNAGDPNIEFNRLKEIRDTGEAKEMTNEELKEYLTTKAKEEGLNTITNTEIITAVGARKIVNFIDKDYIINKFGEEWLKDFAKEKKYTKKVKKENASMSWLPDFVPGQTEAVGDVDALVEYVLELISAYKKKKTKNDIDILEILETNGLADGMDVIHIEK